MAYTKLDKKFSTLKYSHNVDNSQLTLRIIRVGSTTI